MIDNPSKSGAAQAKLKRLMAAVLAREAVERVRHEQRQRSPRSARPGFMLTDLGGERPRDDLVERRLPSGVLRRLGPDHPLTAVAERYSELVAGVGSMAGAKLDAPAVSGVSDGGAVARVGEAQQLARMRKACASMPVLGVRRAKTGTGRPVVKFALSAGQIVDGVVIEGKSLSALIRASGRDPESPEVRRKCAAALIEALRLMGEHVGN